MLATLNCVDVQFINMVSGSDLAVGHGLNSCTADVQQSPPFDFDGRQVSFIDTPGFDDTNVSDADILKMITLFLTQKYVSRTLCQRQADENT